jgi:hypothetical protein
MKASVATRPEQIPFASERERVKMLGIMEQPPPDQKITQQIQRVAARSSLVDRCRPQIIDIAGRKRSPVAIAP